MLMINVCFGRFTAINPICCILNCCQTWQLVHWHIELFSHPCSPVTRADILQILDYICNLRLMKIVLTYIYILQKLCVVVVTFILQTMLHPQIQLYFCKNMTCNNHSRLEWQCAAVSFFMQLKLLSQTIIIALNMHQDKKFTILSAQHTYTLKGLDCMQS